MPVTRDRTASRKKTVPEYTSQSTIKAFARVRKHAIENDTITKDQPTPENREECLTLLGKRKRISTEEPLREPGPKRQTIQLKDVQDTPKRISSLQKTPQKQRRNQTHLPNSTPTRAPLRDVPIPVAPTEQPLLDESATEIGSQLHLIQPSDTYPTRASTPIVSEEESQEIPQTLCDLTSLYASFLKALTLHLAYHGSSSTIDMQELRQSTAQIWRKRAVSLDDIRRCLAIQNSSLTGSHQTHPHRLKMAVLDYGDRTCLEIEETDINSHGLRRPIDEERLKKDFLDRIRDQWREWHRLKGEAKSEGAEEFLVQLPLMAITTCFSLEKVKSSTSKGQRRLEDLRFTVKKAHLGNAQAKLSHKTSEKDTKTRSQGLLERMKLKENQRSTLPPAPTKSMLERQAALHRLPEIVRILSFLNTKTLRITRALPATIECIQNSTRSSLSKDEVENCIRVLAEEFGQGYVRLVPSGDVVGVVVDDSRKPENIESWVQRALCA